ncbi:hypothetical protein R3P38DRAFT_492347 [Favolaschia claudopus]|uniref:ATPase AAA-type core domain-containing protein n=1 Tax=Favolaschia claudopus TaxID=2862362 RepID=A0AAW0CJP0_9AGAR
MRQKQSHLAHSADTESRSHCRSRPPNGRYDFEARIELGRNHQSRNSSQFGEPSGYLIYGEPGTGKSTTIHALGGELGLNIYFISLANTNPIWNLFPRSQNQATNSSKTLP